MVRFSAHNTIDFCKGIFQYSEDIDMDQKKATKTKGILYVLFAAALWGTMGVFVRYLNAAGLASLEITQVRITVGFCCIGTYLLLFRRDLLKIRWKDLWCFLGTGIVSLLLFSTCYFRSMEYVSLSTAAILLYTAPIFVMLMSLVLFKERLTMAKTAALALSFIGCILVSGIGNAQVSAPIGILLAIASGFFYALYSIFSRFAIQRGYGALTIVFYTFLFCAIGCAFLTDWSTIARVVFVPDVRIVLLSAALGVITGFLPYVFYSSGLEHMESSRASILASLEPVVGTLFGVFLFKEPITVPGVFGILLVLSAVAILSLPAKKEKE